MVASFLKEATNSRPVCDSECIVVLGFWEVIYMWKLVGIQFYHPGVIVFGGSSGLDTQV